MLKDTLELRLLALFTLLLLSPVARGGGFEVAGGKGGLGERGSQGPSRWSLTVGPSWQRMGQLSFQGGSQSQGFAIPALFAPGQTNDPNIGSLDAFGDRTYDNGFVNQSALTAAQGVTTFWGFDDSSQISGTSLSFSASGSRTENGPATQTLQTIRSEDDLDSFAPQIDLHYRPSQSAWGISSFLVSLSFASSDSNLSFSNFSGSQSQISFSRSITDTFSIGEVGLNPPAGGFEGTFAGPGPVIPNQPADRTIVEAQTGVEVANFSNSVRSSAEISAISLAIGPVFEGKLAERFRWQVAAGTTLTYYDWELSQSESLTATVGGSEQLLTSFQNRDSGNQLGIGLFARVTAVYDFREDWFASSFLQGQVGNSFDLGSGASSFEFEPNGFSLGAGLGYRF